MEKEMGHFTATTMTKIALITPEIVDQPTTGYRSRLYQLQRALELIAPGRVVIWAIDGGAAGGHADPPDHAGRQLRRAARSVGALGLHLLPTFTVRTLGAERERILDWIDRERPTHAVVVHPQAAELTPPLRQRGIAVFLDAQNVESDLARQLVALAPDARQRLIALERWCAIARWELRYFPLATEVWLPSEVDAERQRRACGGRARVRVVPNALDLARYTPRDGGATRDIALPAYFGYRPNVVGARAVRDTVLPMVRREVPTARLILVGRDDQGLAAALRREPDVVVTGEVPDTQPYLRAAGVVVVPIFQGGGTRYKILEAFALGLPVVSTPLGCEGLAVRDGEHLLIREIEHFAEAIIALLIDPARGRELGRRGRELVEASYSLASVEAIMRAALSGPTQPDPVALGRPNAAREVV